MPFKSEKQRRYLWANEPEIARDWTDTYGSRIKKEVGGIMDTGVLGTNMFPYTDYLVEDDFVDQEQPLLINPDITALQLQQAQEGSDQDYVEIPQNKFKSFLNMENFNRYAMPAYNFARGNIGAGILGGLFGGPLGILGLMLGGQGFKNRRRAKEAARIAEIEKAEEAYQKSKTVAPKPYVAPLGPRGNGGNQGSSMGKGQSPTGSDVAGTPFNIGGLAGLWPR
jgi:hypothetical protein